MRELIFESLRQQAETSVCPRRRLNATFQTAFCYQIGFGTPKNPSQVSVWLEKCNRKDFDLEVEISRNMNQAFHSVRINSLKLEEHIDTVDCISNLYQDIASLDDVEAVYRREINDAEETLGNEHPVLVLLRSILARISEDKNSRHRSEI